MSVRSEVRYCGSLRSKKRGSFLKVGLVCVVCGAVIGEIYDVLGVPVGILTVASLVVIVFGINFVVTRYYGWRD